MLRRLAITTTILSSLLMAAHFLRSGSHLFIAISLAMPLLLLFKKIWATRLLQCALVLATIIWIHTLVTVATTRQAASEPWTRMAIILGIVASLACLSAILLNIKRKPTVIGNLPQNEG